MFQRCMYHIVLVPKQKGRVLEGKLARRIRQLVDEYSDVNRWKVDEINIQQDHIQIFLQLRPSVVISEAIELFKEKSSKIIRKEFPSLEEFAWGNDFWLEGFFVQTMGKLNEQAVKKYLRG